MDLFKKANLPELSDNEQEFIFDKIAFCYIYPLDVKESNGFCMMPVTSKTGKLVARFTSMHLIIIFVLLYIDWPILLVVLILAEYFIARPYSGLAGEHIQIKSKTRNPKSWQLKKNGFDIGHRGAGSARRNDQNEKVLENTVDSFNYAFKKGADMVKHNLYIMLCMLYILI